MATTKKSAPEKASIELDSKSAFAIHGLIEDGLTASNILTPTPEKENFALSSKKAKIKIDAKTAMQISKVIKKGLVASAILTPVKK
jgi:hypothetical protein